MVVKGRRLTQKEHWEKLKAELKGMTPGEKLEHLWEYYKWVPAVFAGFLFIVATVIAAIISINTETILAGAIINVPVDPDGYVVLQEGYYERAHTEGKRQVVELTNMNFVDPYTTTDQTYATDILENVTAMLSADVLDYLIYDDVALPFFMTPEMFVDLRKLFTEEELAAMGNAVIKLEMEDGELIPIAIDIRDTAFYDSYIEGEHDLFISFSIRLPRKEATLDFWQFLKGGETTLLTTYLAGTVTDAPLTETGKLRLTDRFFAAQGLTVGDHRVELSEQSFRPAPDYEGEDPSPKIKENVRKTLKDGSLDYIIFGADAQKELDMANMLDLGKVLSAQQLEELKDAILYHEGTPVAVDLSATAFGEKGISGTGYLAFSANTQKLDACVALWNFIYNP